MISNSFRSNKAIRKTNIKVYLEGKALRFEKNISINYSGGLLSLKQQLESILRRSPKDPEYFIISVSYQPPGDFKSQAVTDEFDTTQLLLLSPDPPLLKVYLEIKHRCRSAVPRSHRHRASTRSSRPRTCLWDERSAGLSARSHSQPKMTPGGFSSRSRSQPKPQQSSFAVQSNKSEINSLFDQRREMEMDYKQKKQQHNKAAQKQIEGNLIMDSEACNKLKIELENDIQTLQEQLKYIRTTYQEERKECHYPSLLNPFPPPPQPFEMKTPYAVGSVYQLEWELPSPPSTPKAKQCKPACTLTCDDPELLCNPHSNLSKQQDSPLHCPTRVSFGETITPPPLQVPQNTPQSAHNSPRMGRLTKNADTTCYFPTRVHFEETIAIPPQVHSEVSPNLPPSVRYTPRTGRPSKNTGVKRRSRSLEKTPAHVTEQRARRTSSMTGDKLWISQVKASLYTHESSKGSNFRGELDKIKRTLSYEKPTQQMQRPRWDSSLRQSRNDSYQKQSVGKNAVSLSDEARFKNVPTASTFQRLKKELQVLMKYTGKSQEELQWLIETQEGNAFMTAEKRLDEVETRYYQLLYEEAEVLHDIKTLSSFRTERALKTLRKVTTAINANRQEDIAQAKAAVAKILTEESEVVPCCKELVQTLQNVLSSTLEQCSACIENALNYLKSCCESAKEKHLLLKKDLEKVLGEIELWQQRRDTAPEAAQTIAAREEEWLAQEKERNLESLERMRSLMPLDISTITVREFQVRVHEKGGFLPWDLALYLKETKILHWIAMHPTQIATSNFLSGSDAHFWTNLDRFDIVELRALAAVVPCKFELDRDGKKNAWRTDFFQKLKGLVAQEQTQTVKGGWDPIEMQRRLIRLPDLTEEQKRKDIYFYQTPEQILERLSKFELRQQKLFHKKNRLKEVEEDLLKIAKDEYNDFLRDIRDPEIRLLFPTHVIQDIKSKAKKKVEELELEKKSLSQEIKLANQAIQNTVFGLEELQAEFESLCMFMMDLLDNPLDYFDPTCSFQLLIPGVFDHKPEIALPLAANNAKYLNPEEEALLRKQELVDAMAERKEKSLAINVDVEIQSTDQVLTGFTPATQLNVGKKFLDTLNRQLSSFQVEHSRSHSASREVQSSNQSKTPRSKLLQAAEEQMKQTKQAGTSTFPVQNKLGFLSELKIKARAEREATARELSNQDKPTLDFLSEIKKKGQKKDDTTPNEPVIQSNPRQGFLGNLQMKGSAKTHNLTMQEGFSSQDQPKPAGFLSELKKRLRKQDQQFHEGADSMTS